MRLESERETGGKRPDPVRPITHRTERPMNLDQNDVLTAYLDDELEPEPRLRVNSALVSDPAFSEALHDLTAVRDLVSELVETADAVDVSGIVLEAIRRHREARLRAASWAKRGAALVSAAASLVALAWVEVPPAGHAVLPDKLVMNAVSTRPRPVPARVAETKPDAPIRVAAESVRTAPAVDWPRERERKEIRSLLKSPNLRKVLIVTDVIGGDAGRQVGDLIKKTPRRRRRTASSSSARGSRSTRSIPARRWSSPS